MVNRINKLVEALDFKTIQCYDMPLSAEHPVIARHSSLGEQAKPVYDMHYALEMGFVLSGRMKRYYQTWHTELGPGQIWLSGIWEPHGYYVLQAPCHVVFLAILPEMLATTRFAENTAFDWLAPFIVPPEKRPYVKPNQCNTFLALGRRIIDVLDKKKKTDGMLLRLLILETILELCGQWSSAPRRRTVPGDSFSIINRAVDLVLKSHELLTVHEAAKACNLSESIFTRLFNKVMGLSFADFSIRYRLHGAKEQLVHSQDPIKTIAASWGFTDKSHFHHVFVHHYGCTPSDFRKRYGMGGTGNMAPRPM